MNHLLDDRPRFLSEADCHDIADRLARFAKGGGYTTVCIFSKWTGNIRWARNQVTTSGDVRNNTILVNRNLNGATTGYLALNDLSDASLVAASRRAERMARLRREHPQSDLVTRYALETPVAPAIFSEATYQLDDTQRAEAARTLAQSAVDAGMVSAGYIEVSAHSFAVIDSLGRARYFPYTQAQYSVTVRDPKGVGSGWGGADHWDWRKIDAAHVSAIALDKCLKSRNPVAIEPGRYTTILEPQAVADFIGYLVTDPDQLSRGSAEYHSGPNVPFRKLPPTAKSPGFSRLGERVVDERITIGVDPLDLDLGFPPFEIDNGYTINNMAVYHPVTWIKDGVLVNLAYARNEWPYFDELSGRLPHPNPGAFRMSGGSTSMDEMISTTTRGLLVTRFDRFNILDQHSLLAQGNTRDGLWLIEKGKISKAVKNLTFTESILFALNNVEQLGVPQRVFHPMASNFYAQPQPIIVPSLKVRDFSFTALDDAI